MDRDYAILIVTHGRPGNVKTYTTLRRLGYTGRIFLIVDNLDKTVGKYQEKYGDEVVVFDKKKYIELTDDADNFDEKRAVVYARNACFDIAEALGLEYFIVLDDDYRRFSYKFVENFELG